MSDQLKITSVIYQRLWNLGNYENEKIGASAQVAEGQEPTEVLNDLKVWVGKTGREYEDISEKVDQLRRRKRELGWSISGLKRECEIYLNRLKEISALLEQHGVKVDIDFSRYEEELKDPSPEEEPPDNEEDDEDYDEYEDDEE
jgi:hypothetical protein